MSANAIEGIIEVLSNDSLSRFHVRVLNTYIGSQDLHLLLCDFHVLTIRSFFTSPQPFCLCLLFCIFVSLLL